MLMKGEKLACGFAILVSSECPHLHTFTLLMPVDLKQLRLGCVFIVSREWVHGVLSCLYLVPTYPTPSLSNSFRFPLPVAQLRKAAPCHFLSSCATLILQFSFFSYIFLSSLLYFFTFIFSSPHALIYAETISTLHISGLSSWKISLLEHNNESEIQTPEFVHKPACAFFIIWSSFQIFMFL